MTKAVSIPIRFCAPVEFPSPAVPAILIADRRPDGHIIEAVPCDGGWLVVQRDTVSHDITSVVPAAQRTLP